MTMTLITGANRGLGYETARRLIGLGHTVLAGARDRQRGAEAARELGTAFIHIDPTDDSSVEAAAAWVRSEYGHLDVLINNAGTAAPRVGAEELTADAAMEGFAINVFGPIRVMHAFLPLLRAAQHPRIVNVSSGAGLREARLHDARHTAATVLLLLDVAERTVMSLMGWSSTDMAARYQHVTDTIRQDVARQVDVLIWQARDSSTGEGTVPVSRVSLTAILRLAELGLVHADEAVMADAQEAIEQIRAVLADGVGHSAPDTDEHGPRGTSTEGGETK
jgi:NAD(P)-dependent dehydrogenase (short-subunit alcohol dehydrogenase family)